MYSFEKKEAKYLKCTQLKKCKTMSDLSHDKTQCSKCVCVCVVCMCVLE